MGFNEVFNACHRIGHRSLSLCVELLISLFLAEMLWVARLGSLWPAGKLMQHVSALSLCIYGRIWMSLPQLVFILPASLGPLPSLLSPFSSQTTVAAVYSVALCLTPPKRWMCSFSPNPCSPNGL